jgi:hypothetical protein
MANRASTRTTQLYDRRRDEVGLAFRRAGGRSRARDLAETSGIIT